MASIKKYYLSEYAPHRRSSNAETAVDPDQTGTAAGRIGKLCERLLLDRYLNPQPIQLNLNQSTLSELLEAARTHFSFTSSRVFNGKELNKKYGEVLSQTPDIFNYVTQLDQHVKTSRYLKTNLIDKFHQYTEQSSLAHLRHLTEASFILGKLICYPHQVRNPILLDQRIIDNVLLRHPVTREPYAEFDGVGLLGSWYQNGHITRPHNYGPRLIEYLRTIDPTCTLIEVKTLLNANLSTGPKPKNVRGTHIARMQHRIAQMALYERERLAAKGQLVDASSIALPNQYLFVYLRGSQDHILTAHKFTSSDYERWYLRLLEKLRTQKISGHQERQTTKSFLPILEAATEKLKIQERHREALWQQTALHPCEQLKTNIREASLLNVRQSSFEQ